MGKNQTKEIRIVKREKLIIKKHIATAYMLIGNYVHSIKLLSDTDKVIVIKTDKKFTTRQWFELIAKFQRELDKMTGDVM